MTLLVVLSAKICLRLSRPSEFLVNFERPNTESKIGDDAILSMHVSMVRNLTEPAKVPRHAKSYVSAEQIMRDDCIP